MLKFGLIGAKLGHSFSKGYHNERFQREGIDARYDNYELDNAEEVVSLFEADKDLHGVSVTIPFKKDVIKVLDHLDAPAAAIGAVNTIVRSDDRLLGYNTDAYGFSISLDKFLTTRVESALILGSGGASRAVDYVLNEKGIRTTRVSRSRKVNVITYDQVTADVIAQHHLIVNCTPLGMAPDVDTFPDIPYDFLTAEHYAYDLVYNPQKTIFLARSEERGARIKNGLEMLHLQADRAWQIWQSFLDIEHEGSK